MRGTDSEFHRRAGWAAPRLTGASTGRDRPEPGVRRVRSHAVRHCGHRHRCRLRARRCRIGTHLQDLRSVQLRARCGGDGRGVRVLHPACGQRYGVAGGRGDLRARDRARVGVGTGSAGPQGRSCAAGTEYRRIGQCSVDHRSRGDSVLRADHHSDRASFPAAWRIHRLRRPCAVVGCDHLRCSGDCHRNTVGGNTIHSAWRRDAGRRRQCRTAGSGRGGSGTCAALGLVCRHRAGVVVGGAVRPADSAGSGTADLAGRPGVRGGGDRPIHQPAMEFHRGSGDRCGGRPGDPLLHLRSRRGNPCRAAVPGVVRGAARAAAPGGPRRAV